VGTNWVAESGKSGVLQYAVDYLTRTPDGRILFGSRGAPHRLGSKISDEQDGHAKTPAHIQQLVLEWLTMLQGVKFTHAWGGSVGMPRDWMAHDTFRSCNQHCYGARLHWTGCFNY
jgi:glycine/D-amino acid oxidase-like deaminating enzyme